MFQDWAGLQTGTVKPEVQNQITQLGLNHNLMTQFTSFVAVEERVVTTNGKTQRVEVPVEMPESVSYEGIFGAEKDALLFAPRSGFAAYAQNSKALRVSGGAGGGIAMYKMTAPPPVVAPNAGIASASGGGIGSGSGGGTGPGVAFSQSPSPTEGLAHGKTPAFDRLDSYAPGAQSPDAKLAPDRAFLESKLSPAVLNIFDCWNKQSSACMLAPDGTIEVQLFLTDDSPAAVDQLKSLGLLLSQARTKDKVITGRLPVEKLLARTRMEPVKFVAPVRR